MNAVARHLNALRGHRTFLLVCLLVLPIMVKALLITGDDYARSLSFIADVVQATGIALGASKLGDAAVKYSKRKPEGEAAETKESE